MFLIFEDFIVATRTEKHVRRRKSSVALVECESPSFYPFYVCCTVFTSKTKRWSRRRLVLVPSVLTDNLPSLRPSFLILFGPQLLTDLLLLKMTDQWIDQLIIPLTQTHLSHMEEKIQTFKFFTLIFRSKQTKVQDAEQWKYKDEENDFIFVLYMYITYWSPWLPIIRFGQADKKPETSLRPAWDQLQTSLGPASDQSGTSLRPASDQSGTSRPAWYGVTGHQV